MKKLKELTWVKERDHSRGPKFLLRLFFQSASSNGRTFPGYPVEWFMCLAVNWKRKRIPGLYEVQTKPDTNQTRPNEADTKSKPNQNQTKPDQTRPNQAGSHALQFPKGMQHPLRVALGRKSITSTRTHPKLTQTHRDDTNPTHETLENPRVLEIMHVRGQSRSESRYSGRGQP
jgi:hypothetical protein